MTADPHTTSPAESGGEVIVGPGFFAPVDPDDCVALTRAEVAEELVALGFEPEQARAAVRAYLQDLTDRFGIPAYGVALDINDVHTIATDHAHQQHEQAVGRGELDRAQAAAAALPSLALFTNTDTAHVEYAAGRVHEDGADDGWGVAR